MLVFVNISKFRNIDTKLLVRKEQQGAALKTRGGICILFIFFILLGCENNPIEEVNISDVAVFETIPGQDTTVGYVTLHSLFKTPIYLTKINVNSAVASPPHAQVHGYYTNDAGIMSMFKVKRLEIQPGEYIKMTPGGYHIMISDQTRSLKKGEEVQLDFIFSDGSIKTIITEVVARPEK